MMTWSNGGRQLRLPAKAPYPAGNMPMMEEEAYLALATSDILND